MIVLYKLLKLRNLAHLGYLLQVAHSALHYWHVLLLEYLARTVHFMSQTVVVFFDSFEGRVFLEVLDELLGNAHIM